MSSRIQKVKIYNYRSISNLKIDFRDQTFSVICGANNVGKTNFLRALNLFFSCDLNNFDPEVDISFHVKQGSHGGGYKSKIEVTFVDDKESLYWIKQSYSKKKDEKIFLIEGKKDGVPITEEEIFKYLNQFRFVLVEASNVNLPRLIADIVNEDILPLGLDKRRGAAQKKSLDKLNEFITSSKTVVAKIEDQITNTLVELLREIESIDSDGWKLRIIFPEYSYLREAISNMINFTLYDTNDHELQTKGSGIQRIILLSLIKYINKKSKKNVIWGIDEPEVFLQPSLQKQLFKELKLTSSKNQILITTHSHFFVDLNNIKNTYLFTSTKELKAFQRRPGQKYFKVNTKIFEGNDFEKIQEIKKHLGISKNDSWEIMPYNIVVEGEEDKVYIRSLLERFDLPIPNLIPAGGVTKYKGLIMYINHFCEDLGFRPKVLCLFDKDSEARRIYASMDSKMPNYSKHIDLRLRYIADASGINRNDIEIEDFIYPELLYKSANKYLRKKKYSVLRIVDKEKRNLPAYKNEPVLKFITEIVKQRNENKHVIDFESHNVKLILVNNFKKVLQKESSFKDLDKEFPSVKLFLKDIVE